MTKIPDMREDHISQIPAMQLLINLGYEYITPEAVLRERGEKTSSVVLEKILEQQLMKMNRFEYKGESYLFSNKNISNAVSSMKNVIDEGLIQTNEKIYDLLSLGRSFEETIAGNSKSYTLKYVDWENIDNNVFHITEEFEVERSNHKSHRKPDIVLFVNGIPFCVIECKRTGIDISQGISQHIRNQGQSNIPKLFHYSQILLSINKNEAKYATTGTKEKYWSVWKEAINEDGLSKLINKELSEETFNSLFSDTFKYCKKYFINQNTENRIPTVQDKTLFALCRPERLLEITRKFLVYDKGEKKIARYQQYRAVKKTMVRIKKDFTAKRKGGVIWHTQGSGKSLTMVMIAKSLAIDPDIPNPRIIIVTDRINLDTQIGKTFTHCGLSPVKARSGQHLLALLEYNKTTIITTVIDKFHAALKKRSLIIDDGNIFTLVDESHRGQYGEANAMMNKVLPNACYIGFTGTPLMKKEKNTATKFGGFIDTYTIDQAVEDKAVVPLLYEGRHALQSVQKKPIDIWFERVCANLTKDQKADLKRKFTRIEKLNQSDQKIKLIAYDVSLHYKDNWQGTGFKAQLATNSKSSAIKFKEYFDDIGIVKTEVVISAPDDREGHEEVNEESKDQVKKFWKKMMDRFRNEQNYNREIIDSFKNDDDPEILIVVDKLLTGFDAPRNTVLYLAKSLREHNLLQAIARVNRIMEGKDFGYVIDYYGVLGELDRALTMYSALEGYSQSDLEETLKSVDSEIKSLPQKHSELWDIFKEVKNKRDSEEYELLLFDKQKRDKYYEKLTAFSRALGIALSSSRFHLNTPSDKIGKYKDDLRFFQNLRVAVKRRYAETIDYKEYEPKIQKLLDTYVTSDQIVLITDPVNIMDKDAFLKEVEKVTSSASKADMIAHAVKRTTEERKEEDPVFYRKFSKLIQDAINDYREKRLSEADYLKRATEIMEIVRDRKDPDMPESLEGRNEAQAFYGVIDEVFSRKHPKINKQKSAELGIKIDDIIIRNIIVDWHLKTDVQNIMINQIEDYLIDESKLKLEFEVIDEILEKVIHIAKKRYAE